MAVLGQGAEFRRLQAAAKDAAARLPQTGFDEAWAEGADIVARRNGVTWRLISAAYPAPAGSEPVLDRLAAHLAAGLINRPPTTEPPP